MNDIESLLIVTLRLRILIKSLLRFSEQIDMNIDISTDSYVIEDFFFTEEVFVRIFCFVIVTVMMMMLRKAARSIL
jgi:hypothetical protein